MWQYYVLFQSSSSQEENEQHKSGDKDHELLAACIHLGMPTKSAEKRFSSSTLQSKLGNLFSSESSPRSGIPIKSRMVQSFPSPCKSAAVSANNFPGTSKVTSSGDQKLISSFCDNNDNLLVNSSAVSKSLEDKRITASQESAADPAKGISQAFLSKCLSVCKKYPALSQKSNFEQGKIFLK